MKLARIADLAGQNIAGRRADFRSRLADGELMYEHTSEGGPVLVTMTRVEFVMKGPRGKDKERWMYWRCESHPQGCNYSGVLAEDDTHLEYHIMIEETGR